MNDNNHNWAQAFCRFTCVIFFTAIFASIFTPFPYGERVSTIQIPFTITSQKSDNEIFASIAWDPEALYNHSISLLPPAHQNISSIFGLPIGWIQHTTCFVMKNHYEAKTNPRVITGGLVGLLIKIGDEEQIFPPYRVHCTSAPIEWTSIYIYEYDAAEYKKFRQENEKFITENCESIDEDNCEIKAKISLTASTRLANKFVTLIVIYLISFGLSLLAITKVIIPIYDFILGKKAFNNTNDLYRY